MVLHDATYDTMRTQIIPGILQETDQLEENESKGNEALADNIQSSYPGEFEADYKNLTFQGVPNSTLPHTLHSPQWISKRQDSITGWTKEFGQAIKKISKLTNKYGIHGKKDSHTTEFADLNNNHETQDSDRMIRNLASDLIDSLLAGCPAALFASCTFLRDEHGVRRAPLLLIMLNITITPINPSGSSEGLFEQNYETKYKLDLEYGVSDNRLKWTIIRSYKDLVSLHTKLKLISFQQNTLNALYIDNNRYQKINLPHFPRFDDSVKKSKRRLSSINTPIVSISSWSTCDSLSSLRSSLVNSHFSQYQFKHLSDLIQNIDDSNSQMHLRIERYLKLLNLSLSLRPQSNRLFQFYELSPIGTFLSYEDGFQGKQGYMVIRSTARAQGWRVSHFRFQDLKAMVDRHTNKWFLVRHSYIMYVSDLYSTTPLDIFLVDSKFKITCSGNLQDIIDVNKESDFLGNKSSKISTNLLIKLENGERKLQMIAKSEYFLKLWVSSISQMMNSTLWSQDHRFGSFAPVRKNCFCKFLVDGRDYFWALSEALSMAKDVIFIHDWWLTPELYMRRPVKGNQEFRIDRLLKNRAENGIKIFIVVYRNVGTTVGTDSLWTKHSLLNLHNNIHVIRSPNQWLQNTYFWAHHEKLCIIDHTIAFMGGIDLCYGRYDTPDHVLRDDFTNLQDQNFPGKDYSNARICDFYDLDKPFDSMYDRNVIPRMPWHDVHMMTVGEGARDISRHFVQRWNYLLRQKRPSRPTPLLTPPSDFTEDELRFSPFFRNLLDESTCELQILRSAGSWSMGLKETERSIQNAYLKLIETSKHYIYIENQFFITSSSWDGVVIENKIGDAIVDRIIKANNEGKPWKAFILIPLMPGFDSQVDQPEGSSVRVIMQCQYQSISRGETSLFAKLKKLDIDPFQYIQFYSLRKWSTIGPYNKLVTEQLYVHAKVMIVDDRSCIIGSANINERSMAGNRDSEVAIIIRDTKLIKTKMNDEEYFAGKFALELRLRLMREHLGCDVDLIDIVERKFNRLQHLARSNFETLNVLPAGKMFSQDEMIYSAMIEVGYREVMNEDYSELWNLKYGKIKDMKGFGIILTDHEDEASSNDSLSSDDLIFNIKQEKFMLPVGKPNYYSFNNLAGHANAGIREKKPISTDSRLINNKLHLQDLEGLGPDGWKNVTKVFKQNVTQQLNDWAQENLKTRLIDGKNKNLYWSSILPNRNVVEEYLKDESIESINKWNMLKRICYLQHLSYKKNSQNKYYYGDVDSSRQPINNDTFDSRSEKNDELDDESLDELISHLLPEVWGFKKLNNIMNLTFIDPYAFEDPLSDYFYEDMWFSIALRNTMLFRLVFHCQPDNSVQTWRDYKEFQKMSQEFDSNQDKSVELQQKKSGKRVKIINSTKNSPVNVVNDINQNKLSDEFDDSNTITEFSSLDIDNFFKDEKPDANRRRERKNKSNLLKLKLSSNALYGLKQKIFERPVAKKILERIHGHLVIFPIDWLAKEVESKNWFYNVDRLPPIDIYD